ncbi:SNW/SKI-interacting protein-like [Rutidosis leptorrhynchoides]|uniref:SNW/SKI-interacting protein-like n=1 Tax=Rutidosis leptorrhynchoides TaxID=125765 RepID=UPI003A9930A4
MINRNPIPLYNTAERLNYRPSKAHQYGDGGAFPEIHYAQYPLDMGSRNKDSSSVPVMHSPSRPGTVKDQQDFKIPTCISNWKNPKGYTIALDKRLAADGRGLQEVQINNDNFAKLSEALYVAEQRAREAVAMRSKVQKEMTLKDKEPRCDKEQDAPRESKEEREDS